MSLVTKIRIWEIAQERTHVSGQTSPVSIDNLYTLEIPSRLVRSACRRYLRDGVQRSCSVFRSGMTNQVAESPFCPLSFRVPASLGCDIFCQDRNVWCRSRQLTLVDKRRNGCDEDKIDEQE